MVFVPSAELHDELLRTPEFVRFTWSYEDGALRPVLAIKASTLSLKYLIAARSLEIVVVRVAQHLAYAVEINDGGPPALVWSLLTDELERRSIVASVESARCAIHLFSEAAVNVASADGKLNADEEFLSSTREAAPYRGDIAQLKPMSARHWTRSVQGSHDRARVEPKPLA